MYCLTQYIFFGYTLSGSTPDGRSPSEEVVATGRTPLRLRAAALAGKRWWWELRVCFASAVRRLPKRSARTTRYSGLHWSPSLHARARSGSTPFGYLSDMKRPAIKAGLSCLVEVVGVEPTSENISIRISPSAAGVCLFAPTTAHRQAIAVVIPLVPRDTGHSHEVFLHSRCQTPCLQVNKG